MTTRRDPMTRTRDLRDELVARDFVSLDWTAFMAVHEAAHYLDLGLRNTLAATIDAALVALPPRARLRAEGVAVAVSLLIAEHLGYTERDGRSVGMPLWTREHIVRRASADSSYGLAPGARPTRRRPCWTEAEVDAAVQDALDSGRAREIAYRVATLDLPDGVTP